MKRQCAFIEGPLFEGSTTFGTDLAYEVVKKAMSDEKRIFCDYHEIYKCDSKQDDFGTKNIGPVVTKCENIRMAILEAFNSNRFPIVVGGDHSLAMASLAAGSETFGIENYCVIYIDGHCDINTEETSLTHNIHGMPLAASMGLCHEVLRIGPLSKKVLGSNIFIIGARSIDEAERYIVKNNNVNLLEQGDDFIKKLPQFLEQMKNKIGLKKVHLSIDVDSLDPSVLKSTGYVMPNGLLLETVTSIVEYAFKSFDVVSADLVEYNPAIDCAGKDLKVVLDILKTIENHVI